MPFKLISSDGVLSFELRTGATLVVGRAPNSDIPVIDPTISRRHAEVECSDAGVTVRDLGSSNGTFVNGTRVETSPVSSGDVVTFGKVAFRLQHHAAPAAAAAASAAPLPTPPGATIVRQLPVRVDPSASLPGSLGGEAAPSSSRDSVTTDKNRQKLAILLEVSKGLGRTTDI